MIEAIDFRNGMSLLATAVNVVTTQGAYGRHGFTASAVCSVTDTPPTLLVCMNKATRSHDSFVQNKALSVNVLGAHQQHISNAFASRLDSEERFKQGSWTELKTGAPILEDALVSFDCEIDQVHEVGTHSVFMCRVVAIKQDPKESNQQAEPDDSLIYFNRAYHQVSQTNEQQ